MWDTPHLREARRDNSPRGMVSRPRETVKFRIKSTTDSGKTSGAAREKAKRVNVIVVTIVGMRTRASRRDFRHGICPAASKQVKRLCNGIFFRRKRRARQVNMANIDRGE